MGEAKSARGDPGDINMRVIGGAQALENQKKMRPQSVWAIRKDGDEVSRDIAKPGMGGARIYTNSIAIRINPKYSITSDDIFFCIRKLFC